MTARIVCHSEDCPRLCPAIGPFDRCLIHGSNHACPPCSGAGMVAVPAKEWADLVAAAEHMFDPADGYPDRRDSAFQRVDDALLRFREAADSPGVYRAEPEGLFNVVTSPNQPRDTISLVQVKDGKAVEVGRVENVRAETGEK